MNEIKISVNFEKGLCVTNGINLITGDYNSTKLVFEFDKEDGTKTFKMANPNGDLVLEKEIVDNELILVGQDENENDISLFATSGDYPFEITLVNDDDLLTSASNILSVKQSVINESGVI